MTNNNSKDVKKYLIFKLGNEEYGIDIHKITTIIRKEMSFARVPKTPSYIKGVFNLRGEIIPVISLRIKFGLHEDDFNEETRIIIIKLDEFTAGVIVDSVSEVLELVEDATESIASIAGEVSLDYITGIGKFNGRIITLLNIENLVALNVIA